MAEPVAPEFIPLQQAVAGRYSLERELGRGGMGIVFLARDVALDRPVAIKLLPPELAAQPALRERFLGEARTAAKLSHPNIVPIHGVEERGALVFFVMSYIEGRTLGDRLRMQGPLTPAEGTKLVMEIAWALAYAHGCGVVHADVKPDNIILESATGRAVVTDFGIAAAIGAAGGAMGTAEYMSPEQAQGLPLDGRSDLYSLGAMAFYALAGTHPFEAVDTRALLAMHITLPAPPVAGAAPGIPRRLAQAIDKCLAKDPADRFPSGEALAEALSQTAAPRRELPVAVRMWLTKGQESKLAWFMWYIFAGPGFGAAAWLGSSLVVGNTLAWVIGIGSYVFTPIVIQAIHRLWRLRKLLAEGYAVEDAQVAVRGLAERRREELAYEYDKEPPLWAKVGRKLMVTSGALAVSLTGMLIFVNEPSRGYAYTMMVSMGTWLGTAVLQTVVPGRRFTKDTAVEWRLKFWNSRFARWFERVARLGLKRRATPAELTYRPTELAISLAADAVFASLDRDTRRSLKELPGVMERLQSDAQAMRKAVEDLGAGLAAIGEEGPAAGSATLAGRAREETERLRADLTARRDEAAQRLASTVAALENIRIGLLRLKAGAGTRDELTENLEAARALSRDMDTHLDAQREVNALLGASAPREHPTPPTPAGVSR